MMVSMAFVESLSPASSPTHYTASDVSRGMARLFARNGIWCLPEMALRCGRRAYLMGIDTSGHVIIVEIKVSRADLLGDGKWTDYLAHFDRFYWALPAGFDLGPLSGEAFLPERAGIIVADRYDAAVVREASTVPLVAATRKKCTLAFARRAARRVIHLTDRDADTGV